MKPTQKGRLWEDMAVEFLKKNGYRIVERNFQCRGGEVDVIAEKKGWLVFVEVRGRSELADVSPAETVNVYKMRRIIKAAAFYLKSIKEKSFKGIRFDVVGVRGDSGEVIEHIENAFSLEDAGVDSFWGGFYG